MRLAIARGGEADARPQFEHVDAAERVVEDVGAAPSVGWMRAAAICSSVVLPAPFGPSITQRSSPSTVQLRDLRIGLPSRTTDTSESCRTVAIHPA